MRALVFIFVAAISVPVFGQSFTEQWTRPKTESLQNSPACQEFKSALASQPATPQAKADVLRKWPGFPLPQVQAIQLILRTKNPPSELDSKTFLAEYAKLGNCEFDKTVALAMDLQGQLKIVKPEERKGLVEALDLYLQQIANRPGSMLKVAVGISIAESLSANHPQLQRKDRFIKKLKEQSAQKTRDIQQALASFADVPTSVSGIWSELHDAERLRMELARILFFP
jgi:hypothetical protein